MIRLPLIHRYLRIAAAIAVACCGAAVLGAATDGPKALSPTKLGEALTTAAKQRVHAARQLAGKPSFGPNVVVFTPSMRQSHIQATVDSITRQQVSNQFGAQRYALFVPTVRHHSVGPAWISGTEAGTSLPINRFLIAKPDTPERLINLARRRVGNTAVGSRLGGPAIQAGGRGTRTAVEQSRNLQCRAAECHRVLT
jgi:hypothetical protein